MRIEFCGSLASGKSTLAQQAAAHFGWRFISENIEQHPYLATFYTDPAKYYFETATVFATNFLHDLKKNEGLNTVHDTSLPNIASYRGLFSISRGESSALRAVFKAVAQFPPPNLLIYIQSDVETIMQRLRMRGRDIESEIQPAYIEKLISLLDAQIKALPPSIPLLRIQARDHDVIQSPESRPHLMRLIEQSIKQPIPPAAMGI